EEMEPSFGRIVGAREFERVRMALLRLADEIDPGGAFGEGDEPGSECGTLVSESDERSGHYGVWRAEDQAHLRDELRDAFRLARCEAEKRKCGAELGRQERAYVR